MAGVKRLLLVLKKYVRPDLLSKAGFESFCKTDPIPVSPVAWDMEAGVSHYGYLLEGLKLKDIEVLDKWIAKHGKSSALRFEKVKEDDEEREQTIEEVLAPALRINDLVD